MAASALPQVQTEQSNIERQRAETEHIWRGALHVVHTRFDQAKTELLTAGGETPSDNLTIANHAAEAQRSLLDTVDTDSLTTSQLTANNVALVVLEMPGMAEAMDALDSKDHTSSRKTYYAKRTAIRFNHDLANAISYMPPTMMEDLEGRLERLDQNLVKKVWVAEALDTRLQGLIRGVTLEVAVWRALRFNLPDGWMVEQGSIKDDAQGADLIVTNPHGVHIEFDVKAKRSFDIGIVNKLEKAADIPQSEIEEIAETGTYYVKKERDGKTITHCTFDANQLGDIKHFEYADPKIVVEFIMECFTDLRAEQARLVARTAFR